jgi:HAD superfamily hydrolase (TIGR01458 family)
MHQKLVDFGLPIEPEECFGVIRAAQAFLRKLGKPRCYFLLTDDPLADFAEFATEDKNPDIVLVGDVGKVWDYALMQKVFEMIMNGSRLVALHKGKFWQTEKGLQMDLGAFVAGLEYVTKTTATVLGKPNREMFQLALDDMGLSASDALMVGDDLDNDIAGAQGCGLKGVLVRTGKFREDIFARSPVKPDLVIDSLDDLLSYLV